jgi:hypothetical protein
MHVTEQQCALFRTLKHLTEKDNIKKSKNKRKSILIPSTNLFHFIAKPLEQNKWKRCIELI